MSLQFYQIIYDEDQRQQCYPFATVYKNDVVTPFFENEIIARLIDYSHNTDLFAVVSHSLARKRGDMYKLADKSLTLDKILNADFDVAILTPRGHRDIKEKILFWHPTADMAEALNEFDKFIKFPDTVKNAIYENHFIARTEIYQEYVKDCLIPAMNFMMGKDVFFRSADYLRRKNGKERLHAIKLLESWGMEDYPLAPFILERLFSIWTNDRNYKVINL